MADDNPSLKRNPRVSQWLRLEKDKTIQLCVGKVELGQGIWTALRQIAADGLRVPLDAVVLADVSTTDNPDERFTNNSMSIVHSGTTVRWAAMTLRELCLRRTAERFSVTADAITVRDGVFSAPDGRSLSYWDLDMDVDDSLPIDPPEREGRDQLGGVVGRPEARIDGTGKVKGLPVFAQDLRMTGQLFGRVIRPPSLGAHLTQIDIGPVSALAHLVHIVHDGDYLGIVCDTEDAAIEGAVILARAAQWTGGVEMTNRDSLGEYLRTAPAELEVIMSGAGTGGDDRGLGNGDESAQAHGESIRRSFSRGFVAHAAMGPSASLAVWRNGILEVWSHTQGIYPLRTALSQSFGIPEDRVVVNFAMGPGCYGHNCADDVAFDAAFLSKAVEGRPVHVMLSREDEFRWEPYGPAMSIDIDVVIDSDNRPIAWAQDVYGFGHFSRPGVRNMPPLLGYSLTAAGPPLPPATEPPFENGGGLLRNAVPAYDIQRVRASRHHVLAQPLRTSALRALGAHLNVYAIESVIDELAERAGMDPFDYRLELLSDMRSRDVLTTLREVSGWDNRTQGNQGLYQGMGYARYKNVSGYCGVVAVIEAEAEVVVKSLTIVADIGRVINPDGARNQLEGGAIQATSWTTLEEANFGTNGVSSTDWESYPILRFDKVPDTRVVLMDRPDEEPIGAGEIVAGPTAAAIGGALSAALETRICDLPLTSERIENSILS